MKNKSPCSIRWFCTISANVPATLFSGGRFKTSKNKNRVIFKLKTNMDKDKKVPTLSKTAVSSSALVDNNLIGKELYYRSRLTGGMTKFIVKNIVLNTRVISKNVCFSIDLISENLNKYTYEEDFIFSEVL